jgi:hypothetical protein
MESKLDIQEETKATPGDEGASILDRLEQKLAAPSVPDQTNREEAHGERADGDDEPDDGGESPVDQPQLSTSDFAKLLGVDETALTLEEDGSVKFKTKIDGSEGAAKLADVLKSYQLEGHVNKRSMELADREKAMQAKQQEAEQQFSQRMQYAEGLANLAAKQLVAEYQSIDWPGLERQDPGTAALYRQKFQERQAELQGVFHNIQREKSQNDQKSEAAKVESLRKESERLPSLIPEWKDQAVANKEKAEILAWAQKAGYEPEEMEGLTTKARGIQLLRKAMLADRLQASRPEIENKVRKAPVLVKPGQAVQDSKEQKLQNLRTAVRKSGGKGDAVEAYLLATGKV